MKKYFFTEKGLTLIEILASITILFIIIMSLLSFFVQSSRTNNTSKKIMDGTYVAESNMEVISNLVSTTSSPVSLSAFNLPGYTEKCLNGTCYYEKGPNTDTNGHYVYVELVSMGTSLVTAKVKVYNDSSRSNLEAQMELLLSWKQP